MNGVCSLTLCLVFMTFSAIAQNPSPLKVSLYYESYCGGCQQYFGEQLLPTWNDFQDKILIDLVPFGNAQQWHTSGHWSFTCQHGPKECLANKLHACAILQACGHSGSVGCAVDKLGRVLRYIHCVEQQPVQYDATPECANKENLNSTDIIVCANSIVGDDLLNYYGNRTEWVHAEVKYVPAVAINGAHDVAAEDDLKAEICKLRPVLCETSNIEAIMV